jgi:phage gpG-like protein
MMLKNKIERIQAEVRRYAQTIYPGMAGKKALQFIDGNFRNQSWEGQAWKRRKVNNSKNRGRALLILRGRLRRGNRLQAMSASVRVFNAVPYAKAHNEGFTGTAAIGAHNRKGKPVKSHSRKMRIPRRQYMPTSSRPSPTLNKTIQRQVTLDIMKILKYTR